MTPIVVTPEYNAPPASLTNAIDYLYEVGRQAVGYVGYGIFGAAVQKLRAQAGPLRMANSGRRWRCR